VPVQSLSVEAITGHRFRRQPRQRLRREPQDQGFIADTAGQADAIGAAAGDEHRVARCGDEMAARPVVLGEDTGQRQDQTVGAGLFHAAACCR
jgi:hypothetical protein